MLAKKFYDGETYHIFNKSIANFKIFNFHENSYHFLEILDYYNDTKSKISLSKEKFLHNDYKFDDLLLPKPSNFIKFIAYCIMPDHFHLLVKVLDKHFIYHYLNNIGNSYTRFLNTKLERKGPLWQSAYKMVRIKSNEQLLHVSRYIHLNPTTARLVASPEDWEFSSYRNLITNEKLLRKIITEISINNSKRYQKFVEGRIDYQKTLAIIKKLQIV